MGIFQSRKIRLVSRVSLLSLFEKHGDQFLKYHLLPFLHFQERSVMRQICHGIQNYIPAPNFVYIEERQDDHWRCCYARLDKTTGFLELQYSNEVYFVDYFYAPAQKCQSGVMQVVSNESAFAALKNDGTVFTWGEESSIIRENDEIFDSNVKVIKIFSNEEDFAALDTNGKVTCWGINYGRFRFDPDQNLESGVIDVIPTHSDFAALKSNGQVVCWGELETEPRLPTVKIQSGVQYVVSNNRAWVAIKTDGSVITFGHPRFGGHTSPRFSTFLQRDIVEIQPIHDRGFRATDTNGFSVQWGYFGESDTES